MDIYEEPDTGEWKSEIVSRFDAQPSKRFTPSWQREYPTARLVMRLRKNDLLQLRSKERTNVYYVQKLSGGRITLAPHFEANVDAIDRSNEDPFSFLNKAASSLQASDAKRVHISATGLLSEG
jgi:CRISPR-associated endonuclease Csn1